MRCARELFPESEAVGAASMWSRNNRSRDGPLREGALCPTVNHLLALPKGLGLEEKVGDGGTQGITGVHTAATKAKAKAAAKAVVAVPPTVCAVAGQSVACLASHALRAAAAAAAA